MGPDANRSYADGKIKAELGDDPERTGTYDFSFTLYNLTEEEQTYDLSPTHPGSGLYGNWSDASMFDGLPHGVSDGEETRPFIWERHEGQCCSCGFGGKLANRLFWRQPRCAR